MNEEFNEEIQSLKRRFEQEPDSRLFAPLADSYRKSGDVDKAIEICEKGLESYPTYASAHVILGKCFYDKGATDRAKEEFLKVIELDPENMVALKFMGGIFLAEDKRAEATEYFKKLLAIDPMNEEGNRVLKEIEKEFQIREINLADGVSIKDADRPKDLATMTLAGIYAAQGYYNRALKIYRNILQKEPGNNEVKKMVDKLQSIMESTDKEREEVFEEDVLTISVDELSEDVVSSTAGEGGEAGAAEEEAGGPEPVEGKGGEKPEEAGGPGEPPEEKETAAEDRESRVEPERKEGKPFPTDMENFRDWIRRLKED